ncbi:MAG: GNAT family N-acyltransferase [Bacteroidota bacterium]
MYQHINIFKSYKPLEAQVVFQKGEYVVEVCKDRSSLNTAFELRYRAYRADNAIEENDEGLFYDAFDFTRNHTTYLVWYKGKAIASVRAGIYSKKYNWSPTEASKHYFKVMGGFTWKNINVLESNRFVVDPKFQGRQSFLAELLLFRTHALNAYAHACEKIVTTTTFNHIPHYENLMGMNILSAKPKYYDWLNDCITLMGTGTDIYTNTLLMKGMPEIDPEDMERFTTATTIDSYKNASSF